MYQVGVGVSAVPTVGTKYLSTGPYVDEAVPRKYDDCVIGVPSFDRSLDRVTLRGQYRLSVGELEIDNHEGRSNYLLPLALDGSEVRVFIAAVDGSIDPIELYRANALLVNAPSRHTLKVTLRDAGLLINKSIGGEIEVGGTGPSANQFRPFNFGWVHQVEPILYDETVSGGQFVHSDTGANTEAVAVRNDGVAVTFSDNGDGTFTLAAPPAGNEKITCDVVATLGSTGTALGYRLSDLMEELVGNRGGLTALGRYAGPLNDWIVERTNDYPSQISIRDKQKLIDVIDEVMDTLNGYWAITRLGQFFYYGMSPASIEAVIAESGGAITVAAYIVKDDISAIRLSHNAPKFASYQCYSNVNQFEQTTFASSLTPEERAQFERIGYPSTHFVGEDPGTTSYLGTTPYLGGAPELYHLTLSDSEVIRTIISGETDAATPGGVSIDGYMATFLALRRALYLPWMEFIDISVGLEYFTLEIGDIVHLTYDAWGLDAGVLYQVCSVGIDASARKVNLGVCRRRYAGVLDELPNWELREDGGQEYREDGGNEIRE